MAYASIPVLEASNDSNYLMTNTWTPAATIAPSLFTAGHTYLVIGTSLISDAVNSQGVHAAITMGGNFVAGTESCHHTSGSSNYKHRFCYCIVNGSDVGLVGLQYMVYKDGSYNAYATSVRLVAIDLNAIPNDATGWQHNFSSSNISLSTSWNTQSSYAFTPDGVSDYLVIGSVELTGYGISGGYNFSRLRVNAQSSQYPQSKSLILNSGARDVAPLVRYIEAPSGTQTITLEACQSSSGYGFTNATNGRIFVLRLNGFRSHAMNFRGYGSVYNNTSWNDMITTPTPAPIAPAGGEDYFVFRKVEPYSWNISYGFWQRITSEPGNTILDGAYANPMKEPQGSAEGSVCLATKVSMTSDAYDGVNFGVQCQTSGRPYYNMPMVVAFELKWGEPTYEDAAATSSITTAADAVPTRIRGFSASGPITVAAVAVPSRVRGVASSSLILFDGDAYPSHLYGVSASAAIAFSASALITRLRNFGAQSLVAFVANAQANLASLIPLPSINRAFSDIGELRPSELTESMVVGDDTPGVNNRLVVVAPGQFGIDPTYVPPGGIPYTFAGPPDGSTNPIQLGFKPGDKLLLKQAQGQPVGPSNNKIFTIYEPATLAVLEAFDYPDSTVYKFYAIRRGI